jgi:hypothetical protein
MSSDRLSSYPYVVVRVACHFLRPQGQLSPSALGREVPPRRNLPPRYNAAPSQELWAIRQHPDTGQRTLDLLKCIPYWMKAKPKPPPINTKAETAAKLPYSATRTGSAAASCRSTHFSGGTPCSAQR